MSEPKPFASLSSGLLARKGAAKPAMRPQSFSHVGNGAEDLGWNDMGYAPAAPRDEPLEHVPSSITALTPAPRTHDASNEAGQPPVVDQQRAIAASFAADDQEDDGLELVQASPPAAVLPMPHRPRQAPGSKSKAAFTLRLDPDRHLKLRLACAVKHRSAQQIVSQALDDFLKALPELDSLAQQLPAQAGKRN